MLKKPILLLILIFLIHFTCSEDPLSENKNVNYPPSASFTIEPDSGDTSTNFLFDASVSTDKEDSTSILKVRWKINYDDQWDTEFSTSKKFNHQFQNEGIKKITVEVMDSGGLVDTATNYVYVSIKNTPPVASFTVDADTGSVDKVFKFDASTSFDSEDAIELLNVRWDWENNNTWDTNYSNIKIIHHQFNKADNYTIKLEVKDSGGLTATETKQLIVKPSKPVIMPLAIGNEWVYADTGFYYDGTVNIDSTKISIVDTSTIVIDNSNFKVFHLFEGFNYSEYTSSAWLIRNDSSGLSYYGRSSRSGNWIDGKNLIHKFPVNEGDEWIGKVYFATDYLLSQKTITCVSTNERLNTPLGEMECYVYKYSISEREQVYFNYEYFKENIGKVGSIHKNSYGNIYHKRVLKSYKLNN